MKEKNQEYFTHRQISTNSYSAGKVNVSVCLGIHSNVESISAALTRRSVLSRMDPTACNKQNEMFNIKRGYFCDPSPDFRRITAN